MSSAGLRTVQYVQLNFVDNLAKLAFFNWPLGSMCVEYAAILLL